MMAGSGEELLVRRDRKTIDLRIRVLNRARADARQSLPESGEVRPRHLYSRQENVPNCMVVTSYFKIG